MMTSRMGFKALFPCRPGDHVVYIIAADNGTLIIPKYTYYYNVPLFGIQQSAHEFLYSSSTRMCPEKCVTSHSGSVAGRTNFLAHSKQLTCKEG
ncbi:hypothetical protein AVEN_202472-1 [Araneus ventricosus]|uniref:Uncharacterized protein n=1 Tax=Araneus ventricosus TaxID=182803 RepID=A0A4Y2BRF4_ARAVE|nr:hypothetical protein AVEN_202472-1 [Araneus ventricosus]